MSSPRNVLAHRLVKDAKWLDGFASFFGAIVGGFYKVPGMRPLKSLLHGTWPLGHPLHPALTDITIGGYTILLVLDVLYLVTRDQTLVHAADVVLVVSLISSLLSTLSGLTDWNETFGEERRNGMLHGLLMVVATVGFVISLWLRLGPEQQDTAVYVAIVSWLILIVSSYLGGEMVFGYGTEVNRQAWIEHPTKWERTEISAASLDDRKPVVAKLKSGTEVFVAKVDGAIYAMGKVCTHAGGPLNEGKWVGADRCEIQCPWHASRFNVKDGSVRGGPATFGEPRFEVRTADGVLELRAKP